jgi:hypothetical protein
VGDVVRVEYLTFTENGRMRECTNPELRKDKTAEECLMDQFVPMDLKAVVVA